VVVRELEELVRRKLAPTEELIPGGRERRVERELSPLHRDRFERLTERGRVDALVRCGCANDGDVGSRSPDALRALSSRSPRMATRAARTLAGGYTAENATAARAALRAKVSSPVARATMPSHDAMPGLSATARPACALVFPPVA
jgi:hypothetical protein